MRGACLQTYNDSTMAEHLIRYNILTRMKYKLPVLSRVIWLLKDGTVPESPKILTFPGDYKVITINFFSIELAKLSPQSFLRSKQLGLLPLVSLTKGGADQEVIRRTFDEIRMAEDVGEEAKQDVEFIAFTLASLILNRTNKSNLEWLRRSFRHMHDVIRESPIYQDVLREGEERGRQEGREEGRLEGLRTVLAIVVQAQFAELISLAQQKALQIQSPSLLNELILGVIQAKTLEQARVLLLP